MVENDSSNSQPNRPGTPTETVPGPCGPRAEWQVGDVIEDLYEVRGMVQGTWGLVYFVHHRNWNTMLAVKSPGPIADLDEESKAQSVREAEAWIEVGLHPNVVSCYYVRTINGAPRIFLEYVDGGDLRSWMNQGKVRDLPTILDIAIQISDGMMHAHRKGLIHRDLKPENIVMTRDGTAKVTDFGLAKDVSDPHELSRLPSAVPHVTMDGEVRGTPLYMAPEQWRGLNHAGKPADIYAFGCVLYEMLCGRPVFEPEGETDQEKLLSLMRHHGESAPQTPADVVSRESPELFDLAVRCLAKEPSARPSDFEAVSKCLREVYSTIAGEAYTREEPHEVELLANGLNNRALSMLDIGREERASEDFRVALQTDPGNLVATFNSTLQAWRSGRLTDIQAYSTVREVVLGWRNDPSGWPLLARIHLERADVDRAREALRNAGNAMAWPEVEELSRKADALTPVSPKVLQVLEGHTHGVYCVAMSSDGALAITGCADFPGTRGVGAFPLRLWDLRTGSCVRLMNGHGRSVRSVCLLEDSGLAISASEDHTVRVWSLDSGDCVRVLAGHRHFVDGVAASPCGRVAVSVSRDRTLRVWDLPSGHCTAVLEGHAAPICLSYDGAVVLSGSWDHTLRLWSVRNGECLRVFKGHSGPVASVCLSPDAKRAFSGSTDGTVRVWDVVAGDCIKVLDAETRQDVTSVCAVGDGTWLLSGTWRLLRLWDLVSGRCVRSLEGHEGSIWSISVTGNGAFALSAGGDRNPRLWRLGLHQDGKRCRLQFGILSPWHVARPIAADAIRTIHGEFVQLVSEGRSALTRNNVDVALRTLEGARSIQGYARAPAAVSLYRALASKCHREICSGVWAVAMHRLADDSLVEACCLSDDGEGVLLGGQGKRLNLWDVATGECLQAFDVPFHARGTGVKFVAFCGSEVLALLSGWGGRIEMWEMISGKRLQVFEGESTFATAASLSCNGAFMISGYWTGVVRLWDVSSGKCLWKIGPHPDMVTAVCISADCRLALSSSLPLPRNRRSDTTNTLLVSDIVTGRCVQDFGGYGAGVATAVLSPTNDLVLAPGYDGGLRALSVAEGKSVGTFQGQAGAVTAIGLTPDTKYALTGSSTGALCLWRISTGRCISAWQGHTGEVDVVKLSIDGLRAISFGRDRYLRGWGLEWKLQARRSADWHESARPYVEIFLTLHTPHAPDGISREGKPFWTEDDFHGLITDLQYRGYGWLRPEGVRRKLEEMSASWHGPPPLFWDTP